jgi:hypothetical protein
MRMISGCQLPSWPPVPANYKLSQVYEYIVFPMEFNKGFAQRMDS